MHRTQLAANCDAPPKPHDARVVANAILDEGEKLGLRVTNLSLQKLLYFAHGAMLVERRRPLVAGTFEAWRNGPVHPLVYSAFKSNGANPIKNRAQGKNLLTGEPRALDPTIDFDAAPFVRRVVRSLAHVDPWQLVQLSHAPNSPWHHIVEKAEKGVVLGLRIPDTVILERFAYHKMCVDRFEDAGELVADCPLA